jgi:hypothetical protein
MAGAGNYARLWSHSSNPGIDAPSGGRLIVASNFGLWRIVLKKVPNAAAAGIPLLPTDPPRSPASSDEPGDFREAAFGTADVHFGHWPWVQYPLNALSHMVDRTPEWAI